MLNRFEKPEIPSEATLRYLDGDYEVVKPGTFVRCAISGQAIPLDELHYWNVDMQEAYATPDIALKRHQDLKAEGKV